MSKLNKTLQVKNWHHIDTKHNPANLASCDLEWTILVASRNINWPHVQTLVLILDIYLERKLKTFYITKNFTKIDVINYIYM